MRVVYRNGRRVDGLELGDWVERRLKAAGITEERYIEIKKKFGLPPKCGCKKRKEWLNRVGRYLAK